MNRPHQADRAATTDRRAFLRALATAAGGAAVLGGAGWWQLAAGSASSRYPTEAAASLGPYGALTGPDANGIRLPPGFTSRVVARSGRKVGGTGYVWHDAPDGGACLADGAGWVYVSNSELGDGAGGASVLRFAADGSLVGARRVLGGTERNCAGGATPWGTWLSCEEVSQGWVYETYPLTAAPAVRREAMGAFKHEAAAVDPVRRCVYLTEDQGDGCFYRFRPSRWPDLAAGRLEVLCGTPPAPGLVRWMSVPDPAARRRSVREQVPAALHFDGGEGCVYGEDSVWFTTKGDGRVWRLDAATQKLSVVYEEDASRAPVSGLDNLTRSRVGELFVAEDRGTLDLGLISPNGRVSVFLHLVGHRGSEIAGPAFTPDGTRLYFSSQRGRTNSNAAGVTYEISGPFHRATPRGP